MSLRSLAFFLLVLVKLAEAAAAPPPITAAAFAPDGRAVLIGSQAGIEVRSWPELKVTGNIKTDLANVHDLAFAPDGKTLLAAGGSPGEAGIVEVLSWPAAERLQQISEHSDLVYRVAWSPDGKAFATAGADGFCRVFDLETGKCQVRYEGHSRAVLAIVYMPDGKGIVSAGVDQTLQLWDSSSGKPLRTLDNHLAAVNDLAVQPGTKTELPTVVSVSDDRTVRLWQPTIGRLMRFARLESPPRCAAWSADGNQLLVGCNDGTLQSIDPDTIAVTTINEKFAGRIHVLLAAAQLDCLVGGEVTDGIGGQRVLQLAKQCRSR
jgi:WD40 repeat protein